MTLLRNKPITTLDIETAPREGHPQEYALQPWRYQEGKAHVTCVGLGRDTGEALLVTKPSQYRALLRSLAGRVIATWHGKFDAAWFIAMGYEKEVSAITWIDGAILWKWLINSQLTDRNPSWSLAAAVEHFFSDEPWAQAFIKMKAKEEAAGENDQYWEMRAKLDCIATSRVVKAIIDKLDDRRLQSALITCSSIVPVAGSWGPRRQRGLQSDSRHCSGCDAGDV